MTVYVNASYANLSRDSDSNLALGNISRGKCITVTIHILIRGTYGHFLLAPAQSIINLFRKHEKY